jgi:hypothetical protein
LQVQTQLNLIDSLNNHFLSSYVHLFIIYGTSVAATPLTILSLISHQSQHAPLEFCNALVWYFTACIILSLWTRLNALQMPHIFNQRLRHIEIWRINEARLEYQVVWWGQERIRTVDMYYHGSGLIITVWDRLLQSGLFRITDYDGLD